MLPAAEKLLNIIQKYAFQFLLGCYGVAGGVSGFLLHFQFLLGCYINVDGRHVVLKPFQFLLGCYRDI